MTTEQSGLKIRAATTDDAAWIVDTLREAFPQRLAASVWGQAKAADYCAALVAEQSRHGIDRFAIALRDGRRIGFCHYFFRADDVFINHLVVIPTARGSGVGGALMRTAAEAAEQSRCHRIVLDVFADNAPAIRFYEAIELQRVEMRTTLIYSITAATAGWPAGVRTAGRHTAAALHARFGVGDYELILAGQKWALRWLGDNVLVRNAKALAAPELIAALMCLHPEALVIARPADGESVHVAADARLEDRFAAWSMTAPTECLLRRLHARPRRNRG